MGCPLNIVTGSNPGLTTNMKKISFLIAILLLSTTLFAQKDKIDESLSNCLDKVENQTTAGECECTYAALSLWDKKLNVTYKELMSKLDPEQKSMLLSSQLQWISFKTKEIQLIDHFYGKKEGTMWLVIRAAKILDLTKQRCLELSSYLEDISY